MEKLRIFYNKTNILWTHLVTGTGIFPNTVIEDLNALPKGTKCLEIIEQDTIKAFMRSDLNHVKNDVLIIGEPRPIIQPEIQRDIVAEFDELKAKLQLEGIIPIEE